MAIYENLVDMAEGERIIRGAPIEFSMMFGRDVRAKIKARMKALVTIPPSLELITELNF